MERRDFLKKMGMAAIGAPLLFKDLKVQALGSMFKVNSSFEDRVLVVIRLNGGNDGLNTIIPVSQYANLFIQRENILVPEQAVLNINDDLGFHPVMTGMQQMFEDGKLGFVQGVGYPQQNRSHFRSMDIWSSGLIDAPATTGWLGRNFSRDHADYPEGYPDQANPDPFAISMGYETSSTCQGLISNFSHTVNDPTTVYDLTESISVGDDSCYGSHVDYIGTLISQANAYGARLNDAANKGNTMSAKYNEESELSMQLRDVAKLISGGLRTSVFILNINGFDTHALQVEDGDTTVGDHADLLTELSDGIAAFQDDLALMGLEQRVMGMTFSEFGRQIASNSSFGTDHGDAAPMFFFGTCMNQQITGTNPVIPAEVEKQAALPMETDFRDVYASVLKDWFGVADDDIQELFEHEVQYQNLVGGCNQTTSVAENTARSNALLYPNPAHNGTTLRFNCADEWVKINVLNMAGAEVLNVVEREMQAMQHNVFLDVSELQSGNYLVRVQKDSGELQLRLAKMR